MNKAGFFDDGKDLWAWDLKGRIYKNGKLVERHLVPNAVQTKLTSAPAIPNIAKEAKGTTIENFANTNGWEFAGLTADGHWKWIMADPPYNHLVISGDPKKADSDRRRLQNELRNFQRCMKGMCNHVQQYKGKTADYFYDWQGYYPDDGSLEDGLVNPAAPAPSFIDRPNRCQNPGHLINTEELDKNPADNCPDCGKSFLEHSTYGVPNALEYSDRMQHSPWWRSGAHFDLPEWEEFEVIEPPSNHWNIEGDFECPNCGSRNVVDLIDRPEAYCYGCNRYFDPDNPFKISMHEDERWPLVWESGPWRFEWDGGRLMTIYDRASGRPVEGIQATDYDFQLGKPIYSDDPYRDMIERAMRWMQEDAETYANELQYMPPSDEPPMIDEYPDEYFPEDWNKQSSDDEITDWMIERSKQRRENQAIEQRGQSARFPFPDKFIQDSLYRRQCPSCGGYLERRGDFYTCQKCPFEYPPGGERLASPKENEIIPGQTKIPFEYDPKFNYWTGLKHSYEEMAQMLGDEDSIKMPSRGGYRYSNTFLERRPDGGIALRLHNTDIITYYPDYFVLNTGGWNTMTTRDRINNWIPRGSIFNYKGDLMYSPGRRDEAYNDPYRYLEVDRPQVEEPEGTPWYENYQKRRELEKQYPNVNNDPSYMKYPDAYHWQTDTPPHSGLWGPGTYNPPTFKVDYEGNPIWNEEYKPKYKFTSRDPFETDVRDLNEVPIVLGSRVQVPAWKDHPAEPGTVTEITDPDGDVDNEGRSIGINPMITVLFDDGQEDRFGTHIGDSISAYYDEDYWWVCDDIEVIPTDESKGSDYMEGQLSFDKWYEPGKESAKEDMRPPGQMPIPNRGACPWCGSPDVKEEYSPFGALLPHCQECGRWGNFGDESNIWPSYYKNSAEQPVCPFCKLPLVNGVCPRCGRTEEELVWTRLEPKRAEFEYNEFDDPIDQVEEARVLRDDMLQMGYADKETLITDMAIELAARGLDTLDAYYLAEEVVAEIGHKIYDAYMGADPGKDWPDLSPTRQFPGNLEWKNTWWPIGMPRNQGKVARDLPEEGFGEDVPSTANQIVGPVIRAYPGGLNGLLDDFEKLENPDFTIATEAYNRIKAIVNEFWEGDIFAWVPWFNVWAKGLQEAWELEQKYRNSKMAMGFDNPSADRYRIDTPVYFRDKNSPELLQDMNFLDSEPASFLNVERQYPRDDEELDVEDAIPYHGHPVR